MNLKFIVYSREINKPPTYPAEIDVFPHQECSKKKHDVRRHVACSFVRESRESRLRDVFESCLKVMNSNVQVLSHFPATKIHEVWNMNFAMKYMNYESQIDDFAFGPKGATPWKRRSNLPPAGQRKIQAPSVPGLSMAPSLGSVRMWRKLHVDVHQRAPILNNNDITMIVVIN